MVRTRKTFDCVQMKRQGAARVRAELEGMTRSEELAYWKQGTQELLALQRRLRGKGQQRSVTQGQGG